MWCCPRRPQGRVCPSSAAAVRRAAFDGGAATVALGAALHILIAFFVYAVMNLVVIPLSALHRGTMTWKTVANGLLIHMLGVGLPSALAGRMAAAKG